MPLRCIVTLAPFHMLLGQSKYRMVIPFTENPYHNFWLLENIRVIEPRDCTVTCAKLTCSSKGIEVEVWIEDIAHTGSGGAACCKICSTKNMKSSRLDLRGLDSRFMQASSLAVC